ncbi:hypothetical protein PHJA_001337200 [Phtheirospermum japonicum]|uniref:Uncharacterized protein n=1 Tax=Phtheirospermum japonicum TaxID=374723 RepID=A0A830CCK2_9LAMI|nr:hypothetical protein PHJA_001337200 [Phtheirospermum japonicum]
MIHRKWSLLTGPTTILAGIIGTVVVADLLFVENVRYAFNSLYLNFIYFLLIFDSLIIIK